MDPYSSPYITLYSSFHFFSIPSCPANRRQVFGIDLKASTNPTWQDSQGPGQVTIVFALQNYRIIIRIPPSEKV